MPSLSREKKNWVFQSKFLFQSRLRSKANRNVKKNNFCPVSVFIFYSLSREFLNKRFWPWLDVQSLKVQNVPGTSRPQAASSRLQAFPKSTPTTWTAPSWSTPPRCRRSWWCSTASTWSPTARLHQVPSAATTTWRSGMASPQVSSIRAPEWGWGGGCTMCGFTPRVYLCSLYIEPSRRWNRTRC